MNRLPRRHFLARLLAVTLAAGLPVPVLALPGPVVPQPPPVRVVYVQPLGRMLPAKAVALVRQALIAFYAVDVRVLPVLPLPRRAWYAPRRRWRADVLLEVLVEHLPADGDRIVGLTDVDISTTKGDVPDWGVLGLATLDGRACVLSSFRAGRGVSNQVARERLAKVAVHELGHTLGLPHCPTRGCLMEDARGKVATADQEGDLCPACRQRLRDLGREAPAHPELPWPRPRTLREP